MDNAIEKLIEFLFGKVEPVKLDSEPMTIGEFWGFILGILCVIAFWVYVILG